MPSGRTPGRGAAREAREFDQTYLDPERTTQVHRDYGAHFFRWGFAARFCKGKRVLDFGCGPKWLFGKVLTRHGNMGLRPELYVGADLSQIDGGDATTKTSCRRGGIDLTRDARRLVDEFGLFDVVASFEVIEHMDLDAGRRFLTAMRACCKEDGVVVLSTPRNEGHKPARNHIHEYSTDELRSLIEDCGLAVSKRYGTFGDILKLRAAAEPVDAELMTRLAVYYSDDVLSCFLAPLYPDACKNNLWVLKPHGAGRWHVDERPANPAPRPGIVDPVEDELVVEADPDCSCGGDDDLDLGTTPHVGSCPKAPARNLDLVRDYDDGSATAAIAPRRRASAYPNVVTINSYGGSLLLGAKMAGAPVDCSMEDSGFGSKWQRLNFPAIPHFDRRAAWPDESLRGVVAIAHPPCAAFSIQAKGTKLKSGGAFGVDSDHFKCTREVLDYALARDVEAIAVESVQGAYEGAREVHDEYARKYGYGVFRILQNGATFGVPQWRPRFWCVFARSNSFDVWHEPRCVTLDDFLVSVPDPGPADAELDRRLAKQREVLAAEGWDVDRLLTTPGMLVRNIQRDHHPDMGMGDIGGKWAVMSYGSKGGKPGGPIKVGYRFVSKTLRVLDPKACAPVILSESWFLFRGRNLTPGEYRAVMGFPTSYQLDHEYRLWLSKGVIPNVAAWVIDLMRRNVAGDVPAGARRLTSGETADFQITKREWAERAGVKEAGDEERDGVGGEEAEAGERGAAGLVAEPCGVGAPCGRPAVAARGGAAGRVDAREGGGVDDAAGPRGGGDAAAGVAHGGPGAGGRAAAGPGRARRVVGTYLLTGGRSSDETATREAFTPTRELVLPLLVGVRCSAPFAESDGGATVQVQYQPPNVGGSMTDLDRIVARCAKKLEAEWRRA